MSKYREHNPRELGEYYTTHIMAMTAENLYDKSAIAAELAYRDKRIAELEAELAGYTNLLAADGIAAVWWCNKDGSVTFSLRSRGDVDVGKLAVEYGGGGHPGAAGFKVESLKHLIAMGAY